MENTQKLIDKLNQLNKQNPNKNIIEIELMMGYTIKLYEELLSEKNNIGKPHIIDETLKPLPKEAEKQTEKIVVTEKPSEEKELENKSVEQKKEEHNIPSIGDIAKKFVNNIITKINPHEKEAPLPKPIANLEEEIILNDEIEITEEEIVLKIDELQIDEAEEEVKLQPEPEITSGISFEPPPSPKITQTPSHTSTPETEPQKNKTIVEPTPTKPVTAQGFIAPKVDKTKDLKTLIGINDKILYVNELFGKDHNAFDAAITKINELATFSEAKEWIDEEIAPAYLWDKENNVVEDFYTLVEHYFKLN